MELMKIACLALVVAALALTLKLQGRGEMALLLTLGCGVVFFLWIAGEMTGIVDTFSALMRKAGVEGKWVALLLKVTGVAILTEFAAQICRDAGEGALAQKVALVGKVLVLASALPTLVALCEMALSLLP